MAELVRGESLFSVKNFMNRVQYTDYEGATLENESYRVVMRGPTQFHIRVDHARIEGTRFGRAYLQLIRKGTRMDEDLPETSVTPSDLLCSQFVPLFSRLATRPSIQGLTIEDVCNSPTYHLELVGSEDKSGVHIVGAEKVTYSPSYDICPVHTNTLPDICRSVAHISASDLKILPSDANIDPRNTRTIQGKVESVHGMIMYFKPRLSGREAAFHREISILAQISKDELISRSIRLPALAGVVVSGKDGLMVVGMLMEWIPSSSMGPHLLSEKLWGRSELCRKWEQQVFQTVELLHAHGIVWGDVNPCNIAIDDHFDAWVIDFGGLNNPEFVDDKNMETKEGDWQGVRKIFHSWLPSRGIT